MINPEPVLKESFDLEKALYLTKDRGYYFEGDALSTRYQAALQSEVNKVGLEEGDHTNQSINAGKPNEVKQFHERFYTEEGDARTPVANAAIDGLARQIGQLQQFPELHGWRLREIGYQRYSETGFIGIHKDRASDEMLSVTFTLLGSAVVEIYRTLGNPLNYSPENVERVNSFDTTPGSIMLLRAPGFGNGQQIPHKVLEPTIVPRAILNLRMRSTILTQPGQSK